jgi:predicted nucleotidyltransferase
MNTSEATDRKLTDFVEEVKRAYRPSVFLLFGSRARGEALAESDYDFLIVSSRFEGLALTDRATPIYRAWTLSQDLECLCLTPAEFEKAKKMISLTAKIVEEGVPA